MNQQAARRTSVFVTAALAAGMLSSSSVLAQAAAEKPDTVPALVGRPDVLGEELLGGTFQSPVAGIAFRTPAGCTQVRATADQIARFVNEKNGWELICTRNSSDKPMPLAGRAVDAPLVKLSKAPTTAEVQKAAELNQVGLLDVVAARLKQTNPGIEIIRQEVENLGEYRAGLLVARVSSANNRRLFQQAIVQANDQLYYTLALSTPAAKDAKGADSADPAETVAAETFKQMVETVKLLDRSGVKDDQNQRLYRTRSLFTTFTSKKLTDTLIPEQWMRLVHDGKDIGYTYIVEEREAAAADGEGERVKIGIRSRSYPEADTQVDGETWYVTSVDRRHEDWSNLVWIQNLKKKTADQFVEIGSSDRVTRRRAETGAQFGHADGKKDPTVDIFDVYELNVQTVAKSGNAEPVKRSLPPFYIPQAIGHLLPRLLPTREPKTYLFATYVGDRREVMLRYVDVGTEQEVELAGRRVRAVPVTDRIGIEGSPTIHYIDPATSKYLGSVNNESKITVLPADKDSLLKKWANADLTRPRAPKAGDVPKSGETGSIK